MLISDPVADFDAISTASSAIKASYKGLNSGEGTRCPDLALLLKSDHRNISASVSDSALLPGYFSDTSTLVPDNNSMTPYVGENDDVAKNTLVLTVADSVLESSSVASLAEPNACYLNATTTVSNSTARTPVAAKTALGNDAKNLTICNNICNNGNNSSNDSCDGCDTAAAPGLSCAKSVPLYSSNSPNNNGSGSGCGDGCGDGDDADADSSTGTGSGADAYYSDANGYCADVDASADAYTGAGAGGTRASVVGALALDVNAPQAIPSTTNAHQTTVAPLPDVIAAMNSEAAAAVATADTVPVAGKAAAATAQSAVPFAAAAVAAAAVAHAVAGAVADAVAGADAGARTGAGAGAGVAETAICHKVAPLQCDEASITAAAAATAAATAAAAAVEPSPSHSHGRGSGPTGSPAPSYGLNSSPTHGDSYSCRYSDTASGGFLNGGSGGGGGVTVGCREAFPFEPGCLLKVNNVCGDVRTVRYLITACVTAAVAAAAAANAATATAAATAPAASLSKGMDTHARANKSKNARHMRYTAALSAVASVSAPDSNAGGAHVTSNHHAGTFNAIANTGERTTPAANIRASASTHTNTDAAIVTATEGASVGADVCTEGRNQNQSQALEPSQGLVRSLSLGLSDCQSPRDSVSSVVSSSSSSLIDNNSLLNSNTVDNSYNSNNNSRVNSNSSNINISSTVVVPRPLVRLISYKPGNLFANVILDSKLAPPAAALVPYLNALPHASRISLRITSAVLSQASVVSQAPVPMTSQAALVPATPTASASAAVSAATAPVSAVAPGASAVPALSGLATALPTAGRTLTPPAVTAAVAATRAPASVSASTVLPVAAQAVTGPVLLATFSALTGDGEERVWGYLVKRKDRSEARRAQLSIDSAAAAASTDAAAAKRADSETATVAPATATVAPATATVAPATATVAPATATVAPATAAVAPATAAVAPATAAAMAADASALSVPSTSTLATATDAAATTTAPATVYAEASASAAAVVASHAVSQRAATKSSASLATVEAEAEAVAVKTADVKTVAALDLINSNTNRGVVAASQSLDANMCTGTAVNLMSSAVAAGHTLELD